MLRRTRQRRRGGTNRFRAFVQPKAQTRRISTISRPSLSASQVSEFLRQSAHSSTHPKLRSEVLSTKKISEGGNGATFKIKFRDGDTGVLKVQKGSGKDNLMYEYIAGLKINLLRDTFPHFVETKNIYYSQGPITINTLMELQPHNVRNGCMTAGHQALLLKEVHGITLNEHLHDPKFIKNDLAGVLFQIYFMLNVLQNEFTHYDLHSANVLLDPVANGQPILLRYTAFNPPIEFTCKYVPRVIDYGRCFIRGIDLSGLNASECNNPMCGIEGKKCGFVYIHHAYQDASKRNVSQDLRLIKKLPAPLDKISSIVQFGPNVPLEKRTYEIPPEKQKYATQEQTVSLYPKAIVNVTDAMHAFLAYPKPRSRRYAMKLELDGISPYTIELTPEKNA